ncbi:MAG: hypothetical protein PHU81_08035 [Acidobacteriota bacterium]|nr:hypothetical protein [Acidobacteriota bacterium]
MASSHLTSTFSGIVSPTNNISLDIHQLEHFSSRLRPILSRLAFFSDWFKPFAFSASAFLALPGFPVLPELDSNTRRYVWNLAT